MPHEPCPRGRAEAWSEPALDGLLTEQGGEPGIDYETQSTLELVRLMHANDGAVLPAVERALPEIAAAIDAVVDGLRAGGRLVYVGAGSSGRLAALDASECEATFATESGLVVALVAGGLHAPPLAQEAAEDDAEAGARDVAGLDLGPRDSLVALSASGRTPYVLGAAAEARGRKATTVGVVCVEGSPLARIVEHEIRLLVGPEFLAGSTRLKAGTAQKLVLNMVSTISMIRLGKTYGNLMVDVVACNEKLRARVRRIVSSATGASPQAVEEALAAADGDAKVAIVSLLAGVGAEEARARLERSGRRIRGALEP